MSFRVIGHVRETESGNSLPNLTVQALDADFWYDDLLGEVNTDSSGSFCLEYSEETSKDLFDDKPDVYLVIKSETGKVLKTTKDNVQVDVNKEVEITVDIPRSALVEAGLAKQEPAQWMQELDPEYLKKFTTFTLNPGNEDTENIVAEIKNELAGKASALELMKSYMDELVGNADNNAPIFTKMAALFDVGITPDTMAGHFYGITLAIRTGDQTGGLARFGNILGSLWGGPLSDATPWVGKSLSPISADQVKTITGTDVQLEGPAGLGINHFNRTNFNILNVASFELLNVWMGLENISPSEQAMFGYEKNGGNFIGSKADSVYPPTMNRKVFQLNYRWKSFNSLPPFRWLTDELVQIAEGMYLGQLIFATQRLQSDYDPNRPPSDYKYQNFGYFLLLDETWAPEARRLCPFLDIPVTAPGILKPNIAASYQKPKYSHFTFEPAPSPNCNDQILVQINEDLRNKPTIMHILKQYSDELKGSLDNESPYFLRLQELFNRGIGIKEVRGVYRGALVSWHAEGLLKFQELNTINWAWTRIGRFFSPWTGKSFEDIDPARLKELTDGHETGQIPTFWGTNTQVLRTPKEKFVGKIMDLAGIWKEDVPSDEAREFGYDLKNFFFIAHQAKSIDEQNKDKTVFQFNYRWKKLKTMPPDSYCIDELVQIADGLYLGKLMYATELFKPYDPLVDPAEYKYRLFGYFTLIDQDWHQIRLDIGFDLGNV